MSGQFLSAKAAQPAGALERLLLNYARSFPIRRGKMRVIDALWRRAVAGDTCRVATLRYGNMRISCDLNEYLQRQFYFFGTYFLEEEMLEIWSQLARNARIVFDVGANLGIYSLAAISANAQLVHAFEPTQEIAARLRMTAAINRLDRLIVHEAAVFNETGHAALNRFRGGAGDNEGMNFVTKDASGTAAETVPTVSLDNFCHDNGINYIDLLKLDIQGQEPVAFEGAKKLLRENSIGTIFLELNWDKSGASSASRSLDYLERASYLFSPPTLPLKWKRSGSWLGDYSDIIARAPEVSRE